MAVRFLLKSNLKSFTTRTRSRTPTPTRFPPPPYPLLSAPTTTTTTTTTAPPLRLWLAPSTPFRPIPSSPPHLLLTTRAFSSLRENTSPSKIFIKKINKRVSDLLSWINLQSFPPTVKVAVHTIYKGMLFAIDEKCFELLVRVSF